LTNLSEVTLICIYASVLLIKTCDLSSLGAAYREKEEIAKEICKAYGFGETSDGERKGLLHNWSQVCIANVPLPSLAGLFLFFVFCGISLLLFQAIVGFSRLWIEGIMPSGLLVARAHAISPAVLLFRVLKRRHGGFPSVYSYLCL
jgi:hypothetical protein